MAGGRLALLIAYGPEARAFLQSGLAERLAEEWEVVIVTPEPGSAAFDTRHEEVVRLPREGEGRAMRRVRAWGRGLRRRAPVLRVLSIRLERCAGRHWGGGSWGRLLDEHAIAAVIAASGAGPRTLPAIQAAANRGLPTAVLLNSWKDLSVRADLPAPVTALGVVTPEDSRRLLPACASATEAVGSLHQAAVRQAPGMGRAVFCRALGLDPQRPIALYSTAANDPSEHGRLAWLADRLEALEQRPQLLIRSNPMDDSPDAYAWIARRPGVGLLRPKWEWVREREWNCPLPEDLPWWRGALEHAAFAVSLPSTVALDFAAWGKPSVNLAWDRGAASWAAESYSPIRRTPSVFGAGNPGEALERIQWLLEEAPVLAERRDDAVGAALRLIRNAFPAVPPNGRAHWPAERSVAS